MLKIKYLSGKRKDETVDLDDVKAKSLIEDGLAEEVKPVDEIDVALKGFETKINEAVEKAVEIASKKAAAETLEKMSKGMSSKRIVVGADRDLEDNSGGFKNLSHFLVEVKNSAKQPSALMSKWVDTHGKIIKSTTGQNEGTNIDGGYAVPIQYTGEIFNATDNRVPDFSELCFNVPMQTSSVKIPILKNYVRNNTTAANGVVSNVTSEAANITQSVTNWEQITLSLSKLAITVPVSNELMEDNNVSLGSVVAKQASYQITKQKNQGILAGNSAYTGLISHASVVTINRATTHVVGFTDVMNMYSQFAFDDANFDGSCWFAHPTVIPQLGNLTSGNFNLYFPPGGIQGSTVGTLLGRPIYITSWMNAVTSANCLLLADMSKYVTGYRNGLQSMASQHVFFLTDEQCYRFTERTTGRPGLSGTILMEDGSTVTSPFVALGQTVGGS